MHQHQPPTPLHVHSTPYQVDLPWFRAMEKGTQMQPPRRFQKHDKGACNPSPEPQEENQNNEGHARCVGATSPQTGAGGDHRTACQDIRASMPSPVTCNTLPGQGSQQPVASRQHKSYRGKSVYSPGANHRPNSTNPAANGPHRTSKGVPCQRG